MVDASRKKSQVKDEVIFLAGTEEKKKRSIKFGRKKGRKTIKP